MNLEAAKLLLDTNAIAPDLAAVASRARADVEAVPELVSLWIKPDRHFNAFYHLPCRDGTTFAVSAHVVETERAARIVSTGEHTCTAGGRSGCGRCATMLTRPHVLVQAFPWDYRLPTLSRCLDTSRVRAADSSLDVQACEVRSYRPGMRCTLRYRSSTDAYLFGKVSVETRGAGYAFRTQSRIRAAGTAAALPIRIPEPIAYIEDLALTLVSGLRGSSLYDSITAGAPVETESRDAARALGALHALPLALEERVFAVQDELRLAAQWVALAGALAPHLATVLATAVRKLASETPDAGRNASLLHRDFYDKQILIEPGSPLALLDLDTAAMGDRELDVANFCAHMRLRGLQWGRLADCLRWADAFVGAYPHGLDRARLDWYRRSTLVRLACNYALRPRWRHISGDLASAALEG